MGEENNIVKTLFDNELSEVEKDIVLVLGDDVNNLTVQKIAVHNADLKAYFLTKKLLQDVCNYDDSQILLGLSSLYIKDIVRISHAPQQIKEYDIRYNKVEHLVVLGYKTIDELLDQIVDRIFLLNDDTYKFGTHDDIKKNIIALLPKIVDVESFKANEIIEVAAGYIQKKIENLVEIVFLTNNDRGLSGVKLYNHLIIESINSKIECLKDLGKKVEGELPKKIEELENEAKDIKNDVKSSLIRNIEIITIFIAAITLIIGNVSFIPQIKGTTIIDVARLILILNGCLLAAISTLVLLISKVITPKDNKFKGFWIVIIIAFVLLAIGITLPWIVRVLQL